MNKFYRCLLAGCMVAGLAGCSSSAAPEEADPEVTEEVEKQTEEVPEEKTEEVEKEAADALGGSYTIHVEGDDWGCGVDRAILKLDSPIDSISTSDLKVMEHKTDTDWADESYPVIEVDNERTVTNVYLSDADGNETTEPSQYVTVEMEISPSEGSPLIYANATSTNTWCDPYELTFSLAEGKTVKADGQEIAALNVSGAPESKSTEADVFENYSFDSSDGYTLPYALWQPEEESHTLFVWLHGGGEGSASTLEDTDWRVPILANEVTAYVQDEFQEITGGMNVLVPQSPTYWMDTTGDFSDLEQHYDYETPDNVFTESLHELIAKVAEDTGSDQIVISGCSNGGYMTMRMAIDYGEEYTAFVPCCEALKDDLISDEEIQKLAGLPLYFIWADNDDDVTPEDFEIPTLARLEAAGAENIQVSTTEDVHDTTGRFDNEDGTPYQYAGHWSWIYLHNGETMSEDGISAWQWIAEQLAR